MWQSSEYFDMWLIPQTLAYGIQEDLTSILWAIRTPIGWETKWIGRQLLEGAQFLGCSLVSWSSKKQSCVSLSSTEAEYVAAGSCCAQLLWMRQTLKDY